MILLYSEQAKTVIRNLKDFDVEDFEKWFIKNLCVGGKCITDYLMQKKEKSDGDIK